MKLTFNFNHSFRQIDSKNLKANENDFYYTAHQFSLYKIGENSIDLSETRNFY